VDSATVDLEQFCQREYPRLVGTLSLYCGNASVAEELAQEALARACANWSRVGRMLAPGAWTHRVAINLANSRFRRLAAERRALARTRPPDPDEEADDSDGVAIRQAVAQLPPKQRAALVLRYWVDLPASEAADLLGTSSANVHQLCHRAVAALRTQLGDSFPVEAPEEGLDVH